MPSMYRVRVCECASVFVCVSRNLRVVPAHCVALLMRVYMCRESGWRWGVIMT